MVRIPVEERDFSPLLGGFLQWVRRPERDADHSTPPSAEVKNEWSCAYTPTICPYGWDRDTFIKIGRVNLDGAKEI
jgi:hypothetical protein